MPKFEVNIIERLERLVEVDAKTEVEAIDKVTKMYRAEEIVLTPEDYNDTEFIV